MVEGPKDKSFLQHLINKAAATMKIGEESGEDVGPALKEVERQMTQVSKGMGGDPITGEGVTKSGRDD